jgi:polysaccharide export outer membrane protein
MSFGIAFPAPAQQTETAPKPADPGRAYFLGTGDLVHITVFQQPDMTTDARVAETGTITFPLIGSVDVGGGTAKQAEEKIIRLLKSKGFVKDPQVNVTVVQFNSQLVSVLGHVNRPGRYPLQEGTFRITDLVAIAGGVAPDGADSVTLIRQRGGKTIALEVDLPALFKSAGTLINPEVVGGDSIYVDRYPYFYIYGEVQRPGVYRLEKGMTLIQALSVGGGFTLRAAKKDIQINRHDKNGKIVTAPGQLTDFLLPDDVVYVKESLF